MHKLMNRLSRILTKEQSIAGKPKKPPVSDISISLIQRLQEITQHGYGRIAIYGDLKFFTQASETIKGTWFSDTWEDRTTGAILSNNINLEDFDCVLVGGTNVQGQYAHTLNLMKSQRQMLPVLWVGEHFEFAGGNVCIPEAATNADIYLFNHFEAYFGIRDPLLVSIKATDQRSQKSFYRLVEPNQTLRFQLSELLSERHGPVVFQVYTQHPRLSGGRHYRWRVFADVYFEDSFTSLHGAHYFELPATTTSRFNTHLLEKGNVIVSHCQFDLFKSPVTQPNEHPTELLQTIRQDAGLRISDLTLDAQQQNESGFLSFSLKNAHKGLFCYLTEPLKQTNGNIRESVMANHLISIPIEESREAAMASSEMLSKIQELNQTGWILTPYPIPVLSPENSLEFGIAVGNTNPLTLSYKFYVFDKQGTLLEQANHTYSIPGVYYTPSILALFPTGTIEGANLIIAVPDWEKMQLNPKKVKGQPDLLVRNKVTGDRDLTEFQSCWRNLGAKISDFPHWIMPQKAVHSGSRLFGRVLNKGDFRTALAIVYGSGNLQMTGTAGFKLRLFNPDGQEQLFYQEIPVFGSEILWLDKCFDNLSSFLLNGWGSVLIESGNADLNVQTITTGGETVSLQHLWGY